MKCSECVYEKDCFPVLHILNTIKNTVCKQGRRRNRQQNIDEALANATATKGVPA